MTTPMPRALASSPPASPFAITFDDVALAAERLTGVARRTPVMTCQTLDRLAGARIFMKCESFQRVGAFKFRGAWNAISRLSPEAARRGVVTHSSGNHAQAVALAAQLRGIAAYIVMPEGSAAPKRAAVEGYGGRIITCAPTLDARTSEAARIQSETGAILIPPYNHPDVMAGQGTATLEMLQEIDNLDALIVPIGGGGLMSGACIAAHAVNPRLRVIGAEPAGADDAARSLAAGTWLPQTDPQTVADGLRTSTGELTWPIIQHHVDAIFTPGEDEIIAAMRLVWERAKLIIEPSSAVAVAVALRDDFKAAGAGRVGVIISGGNVDLNRLPWQAP